MNNIIKSYRILNLDQSYTGLSHLKKDYYQKSLSEALANDFNLLDYKIVVEHKFRQQIICNNEVDRRQLLEELYNKCDKELKPSISDIFVLFDRNCNYKAYYCDSYGFQDITPITKGFSICYIDPDEQVRCI